MQKINNGSQCRAKPFDLRVRDATERVGNLLFARGVQTTFQRRAKEFLIGAALVNIGNPQFGLPVKRVRRALKHLFLLGDRAQNHFERRTFEVGAKRIVGDGLGRGFDAAPDRTERFHALLARDKPSRILPSGSAL